MNVALSLGIHFFSHWTTTFGIDILLLLRLNSIDCWCVRAVQTSRAKRAPGARAPKPRRRLADVLAMELAVLRGDAPPQASTRPGEVPLLSSLSTAGITWARASPAVMYIESGAFATPHAATAADGGSAAAAGVPPAPPHCAVCGFVGKYACVRCSAPFCTAGCLAAHKESGRCSTGLGSAASGAAAAAPFRGK